MNKLSQNSPRYDGFQIVCVIKGLIWALIITIILGIIVSLLLQFTPVSESLIQNFSTFIFFISMLLGATIGARAAGCKGLLHGLSVSLVFVVLVLLIGAIWNPETFSLVHVLKRIGYSLLAGGLGGFIGIGLTTK